MPKSVYRALHEIRGGNDLVVVQEHHDVVAQHRCDREPHVPDGPIAAQRYAFPQPAGGELAHAVDDLHCLDVGHNGNGKRWVVLGDAPHAHANVGGGG